jgi:hypothetical protein
MGSRKRQIDQLDATNRDALTERSDRDKLSEVRRAVKENKRPNHPQGTYGVNQFKIDGTGNVNSVFPGSSFDSD